MHVQASIIRNVCMPKANDVMKTLLLKTGNSITSRPRDAMTDLQNVNANIYETALPGLGNQITSC